MQHSLAPRLYDGGFRLHNTDVNLFFSQKSPFVPKCRHSCQNDLSCQKITFSEIVLDFFLKMSRICEELNISSQQLLTEVKDDEKTY